MNSDEGLIEGSPLQSRGPKSVTFDPAATFHNQHVTALRKESAACEKSWSSGDVRGGSNSQSDSNPIGRYGGENKYYDRLYRFYGKYNPEKLDRVAEYLEAYKGEEEQLFAILVGKYGPEPDDNSVYKSTGSMFSSEGDAIAHYSGKRCHFPKKVSPEEGNTDVETPYWASGSTLISDRDLLSLLQNLETNNVELQKCYMGISAQHPTDSWNGMTYMTRADGIASPGATFLGHIWAGTLGSGKVMVHQGKKFHRTTLYCTEECQKQGNHERWRLCVYRTELNYLFLLRTMWDPVVVPEPLPLSKSNLSEREFHSSSEAIPTRLSSMSSEDSSSSSRRQPLQPQQPTSNASAVIQVSRMLEEMEKRITRRLDAMDQRIARLEGMSNS